MVRNKQLCYVCTKVDKIYMSRQGLQQLGINGENFPLLDNPKVSPISDQSTGSECECPTRPPSPCISKPPSSERGRVEGVQPVACHRVQPVPMHWQEKVHMDLVTDVKLGVLEKQPTNAPTTWLSRMVITAKSNSQPRRTVDYQPLNKYMQRQTFPMETPFQLASRIPPISKKTVVDNWNGFHSVSLHPDDRNYTAFLAPTGRYKYKVAA